MTTCLLAAPLLAVPAQAAPLTARAEAPVHTLEVSGEGVGSFPAFDPAVRRYAVTTSDATSGQVTVAATTSDPAGEVYVDGVLETDGTATVTGLADGDEVAVFIVDSAGTARHSLVYLPAGFPTLATETAETAEPAGAAGATGATGAAALAPGHVLLGLTNFSGSNAFFQTAVDRQGVPAYVERINNSVLGALDLKQQPNGNFSISRTTTTPGRTGQALVQLDGEFEPISSTETVDLVNTDGHDSIALPDGTTWLLAYEPNAATDLDDSIIQRIDPDGTVGFEWTSAPYAAETVTGGADYAHVNSIDLMDDGSILASFRGFSSVFKIDTTTPTGSVVWKLGGVDSTFAIEDAAGAPDSGPCAQHTARELDDGSILLFDNGAATPMCADPTDPTGDRVVRTDSRVLRLSLDESTDVATVVADHSPGRFAQFAGSSQAVGADQGHTLIGWAFSRAEVATEIDAAGDDLWRLYDVEPTAAQRYFSYRAHLAVVPDVTDPEVVVDVPASGASYVQGEAVEASYSCTDRGGSSLQTCVATPIDTSAPGSFAFEVTATDGAGNSTTQTRTYTVRAPSSLPDVWVKVKGKGTWVGDDDYGRASSQRVTTAVKNVGRSRTIVVKLQNDGSEVDRLSYAVQGKKRGFRISTSSRTGTTRELAPGESTKLRINVTRGRKAQRGAVLGLRIRGTSIDDGRRTDAVTARITARGKG